MKKKKLFLSLTGIILTAGVIISVLYISHVQNYQKEVAGLTTADIDISSVPDGVYTGECDVDFIYVKAEVTVSGGRITDIRLIKHKNERGGPAEVILDKIVETQSLDVDNVSGATNSSKVMKKAIENALAEK